MDPGLLNTLLFYGFALLTLGGGLLTITRRSAVHSALSLIGALLGIAGLYLLQKAEFLFATQIVLYVGGIMVLFLFVIMLVNLDEAERQAQFNRQWSVALACLAATAGVVWYLFRGGVGPLLWKAPADVAGLAPNTEKIADMLYLDYLLPLEIASVLLLVAVVGSVFMARKRT